VSEEAREELARSAETVRAICLWEPYASLVGAGWKTIETRLWATGYRGRFVVCSTKAPAPRAEYAEVLRRCRARGIDADLFTWEALRAHAGSALGVVTLADCRLMTREDESQALVSLESPDGRPRYSWVLGDEVTRLTPFPVKGRQGWFKLPAAQVEAARAA
jgi:hypothetical protein